MQATAQKPTQPKRVLIIDDRPDAARTLDALVHEMGHRTAFALNGEAALDLAKALQPDVIFVDLVLPDIEGHDLIRDLRALPGLERTMIYVVSAWGSPEIRRGSREAGADGHFVKPMDTALLERLLA